MDLEQKLSIYAKTFRHQSVWRFLLAFTLLSAHPLPNKSRPLFRHSVVLNEGICNHLSGALYYSSSLSLYDDGDVVVVVAAPPFGISLQICNSIYVQHRDLCYTRETPAT